MSTLVLIDFGSTYTKVTAVDPDKPEILGTASSFTTVETDVGQGLAKALTQLEEITGPLEDAPRFACSSAAGGLRMVSCGLVPKLTVEAARQTALGAGAKLVGTHAYELTPGDAQDILALKPDILLLTGGMDGGNSRNLLQNAQALAAVGLPCPVVIAGNHSVAEQCAEILRQAGTEALVVANVMPDFGTLNPGPAQEAIRSVFLRRIVQAKGLSREQALLSGILMPTPAAVLEALRLLSRAWGDLVAVDVGGATTDVYSLAEGAPTQDGVLWTGLPEPYAKRTVEGDLGMRYSLEGVVDAAGEDALLQASGLPLDQARQALEHLRQTPSALPGPGDTLAHMDAAIAAQAALTALSRHAGRLEKHYTPSGVIYQQIGKDLTQVQQMILTGGAVIHNPLALEACGRSLQGPHDPLLLLPEKPLPIADSRYLLAAMGLLAQTRPDAALTLMKKEFGFHGDQ